MAGIAVSWDLVLRHCGAIRAQVELLSVQVLALETYAKQQHARENQPKADIVLPATCNGYQVEDCARQCEEAVISNGRPDWPPMCRGCGLDPRAPVSS